jgi:broad specificity phosphatase PhoE
MHYVLVRHGKPEEDTQRWPSDPPLTARGQMQAARVAERLAREGIDRIIASPLARAHGTAQPLASALGLTIEIEPLIAEVDRNGDAYVSVEALKARGGAEWTAFLRDPVGYLGGDSAQFSADVLAGFGRIVGHNSARKTAIFTHGLPINIMLSLVLGLDGISHFVPRYGSLTRLAGKSLDAMTVLSINETGHFEPGEFAA